MSTEYTSEQLDFHNQFLNFGGLYPYAEGIGNGSMYAATRKGFYNRLDVYNSALGRTLVTPSYDFIANGVLNAVARTVSATHYIGVNAGTMILLNDLFLRMMSSPVVLPHIGDAGKEIGAEKVYNPQQTDMGIYDLVKPHGEVLLPVNPSRQLHAAMLGRTAFNFLGDHELAHIIYGHTRFCRSSYGMSALEEAQAVSPNALDLQTLEMDADCFAAERAVMDIKIFNENPSWISDARRGFYCDWKSGVFNWMFAVYSLFRLFGFRCYSASELLSYTHPPIGTRIRMMAWRVGELVSDKFSADEFFGMHHDAIEAVERAFNEISETSLNRNAIDFAYSDEASEHMHVIWENWRGIRPRLEPYSVGVLAPAR